MAGTTTYLGISYPTSTDLVKDGAANMQTIATGFDSAVAIPTYQAQTGTTYTFALTDIGKTVTASNAGASTYTIPPTASVAWPTNTTLTVVNLGAGVVTFAAGAGVTVTNTAATLGQYQSARLIRTGLNAWTVSPNSGGSGATLLSTTTLSGTSTTITVAANTYRQLIAEVVGVTAANHNPFIQINSITGASDYVENKIGQQDGVVHGTGAAKTNGLRLNIPGSYGYGTTSNNFSTLTFFNPNSTNNKYVESQGGWLETNINSRLGNCVVLASAVISSLVFKSDQSITAGTIKVYGVN